MILQKRMRRRLAALSMAAVLALTGCVRKVKDYSGETREAEAWTDNAAGIETGVEENAAKEPDAEKFNNCERIYKKHIENETLGSLEMVREMVCQLGADGYAVVDQDNQVDMENADQVRTFCQRVVEKQAANLTLIIVLNDGGFSELELAADQGKVHVTATSWRRKDRKLIHLDFDTDHYQTIEWIYPDHGYLIFEKYYMPGFSGPYSHVAVRVDPLDETCRELNRAYIRPVGYYGNNMFLSDWDETDYGGLDFRDLFECLYRLEEPDGILAVTDSNGDIYRIAGREFERIIMKYFNIDSQTLQKKVTYIADEDVYEFRPRSVYDNAGSQGPYPEVIAYEERKDGTVELLVSAVLEEKNMGSAFQHKVVIRPLEDGTFRYISNEVVLSEDNVIPDWYKERLTEEQ